MKNLLTKQLHISDLFRSPDQEISILSKILKVLLFLSIGVTPLILQAHTFTVVSPLLTRIRLLGTGFKADIFTYYKMVFLVVVALLSLFIFARLVKKTSILKWNGAFIFLLLFVIGIGWATLNSNTIHTALFGMFDRHDGALSYLAVLILFFIASQLNFSKDVVYTIGFTLAPFVIINFVLITMNHYGFDALKYDAFRNVLTINQESNNLGVDSFLLGTLNQWNFLSGTFAMMTVFYMSLLMLDKKIWRKYFFIFLALLSFWVMLLSLSTSGSFTVVLLTPILVWLFVKLPKSKQQIISVLLFIVLSSASLIYLSSQNERVYTESVGLFVKEDLQITSLLHLPVKVYTMLTAEEVEKQETLLPELPEPDISGGSGRIYIWIKTLSLVPEKPFFGYGLDTLIYEFPHFSIDARAGIRSETVIVDKPHNMFIGILYGTGLIGFIGFIGLFGFTIWVVIKKILKQQYEIVPFLLLVIAFLIQGIFNDTLPGMTAIVYPILGILLALSKSKISKKDTQKIL